MSLFGLKPGDIVMSPKQYNALCHLMIERKSDSESIVTWNGIRVIISDNMPEKGWFIVPGAER